MPHLSPMYWLLMPSLFLFLLCMINYMMYFNLPPLFKMPKKTSTTSFKWYWN